MKQNVDEAFSNHMFQFFVSEPGIVSVVNFSKKSFSLFPKFFVTSLGRLSVNSLSFDARK